ncbi:DUF397 domain-containing protein [Cryptosporangium aurantiacum]|uniref:DUF397 domain-containing protein n=1 Tax=Cryptosporangium aurantiacum TaxID=134849 RepID=A0A1M7RKA0_9ACTN|nr:DUF397 domain-containing protein [Cryptosporangium aurantiacum]SHN46581.1 protein of unknown function [Cryptosporangium aurantiacum]
MAKRDGAVPRAAVSALLLPRLPRVLTEPYRSSVIPRLDNRVEMAFTGDEVRVRDSRQASDGAALAFPIDAWNDFTEAMKAGQVDPPK